MDKPLRIGLVTDSDAFAGTERHILDLALGLRKRSVEVSLICPARSPLAWRAKEEGLPMIALEKRSGFEGHSIMALRALLASGALDILHTHNGRTTLWATLAKTLSARGHVVATQHFLHPEHTQHAGIRAAAFHIGHRWINRAVDHVVAISNAVRACAINRNEISPKKLIVVHNGISDPELSQLRPKLEIRTELDAVDRPLIVCIARLEAEKNITTLIRALHRMPSPRPICIIAGEGSERRRLETDIRCRKLGESIKLVGFQSDTLSILNAADVFILPSLAEPFGLAILEAMALRKPVIATSAGGPTEIVVDRSTGLLVPPENEIKMAVAIETLINNPTLSLRLGNNGRERFLEHFTADRMVDAMGAIYSKVSDKRFST